MDTQQGPHSENKSSNVGGAFAKIGELTDRVETVEETIEEGGSPASNPTPTPEGEKEPSQNDNSPLERICHLPEHIADRELTANQERARFIARDVRDYAEKAPAGLVIDSRTVKKGLQQPKRNGRIRRL